MRRLVSLLICYKNTRVTNLESRYTASAQLVPRKHRAIVGWVVGWLNILEAHHKLGLELPVNLRFCFEGMEESGSEGLDDLIKQEKDKFFTGVDAVCIVCFSLFLRNPTADSSVHIGTVPQLTV